MTNWYLINATYPDDDPAHSSMQDALREWDDYSDVNTWLVPDAWLSDLPRPSAPILTLDDQEGVFAGLVWYEGRDTVERETARG